MLGAVILSTLLALPLPAKAEPRITEFARNVTTHVLFHELAHALIREFDLPVLGNEESIADSFSTLFTAETMPDRAEAIVKDRVRSWLVEAADAGECADAAPELIRSWRWVLRANTMPDGMASSKFCIIYGEGPMSGMMQASGLMEDIGKVMRRLDWHSTITLHFDHCDQGAAWQRNGRAILLCDDHVARFMAQEGKVSHP